MATDTQESIAAIIAEMRKLGKLDEKSIDEVPRTLLGLGLRTYADRIEAAWKRELGNAAKLREAIEAVLLAFNYGESTIVNKLPFSKLLPMLRKCIEALAEPSRNCDVGTAEEQAERYMNFCHNYPKCTGCPCVGRIKYNQCQFAWAQLPYEAKEGGNNVV